MPPPTLFALLEAEWATLATQPGSTQQLARWRQQDPALARFNDLAALLDAAQQRGQPAATDQILAALARRAASDDLAARTLLQLLLPGAKALSRRLWWLGDPEERAAAVVAALYERIRTYPFARRPAKIAANLVADTQQRLLRAAPPRGLTEVPLAYLAERDQAPQEPAAALELLELLGWAVAAGHLTAEQTRLIGASRIADRPSQELGAEAGLGAHSLRRRRQRAERALAAAVARDETAPGAQPCRVSTPACA